MNNFLNYIKNNNNINLEFIKDIKLNKKSISLKLDKELHNFIFNDIFTERTLYNVIISNLSKYNNTDIDYLKYKYKKLNIKYI